MQIQLVRLCADTLTEQDDEVLGACRWIQACTQRCTHVLKLLGSGLNASLVLATAREPVHMYEMLLPLAADVLERVTGAVGTQALADAEALRKVAGVPYAREIVCGDAVQAILDRATARGCDAIVRGVLGLGALVTHRFKLDDIGAAYELFSHRRDRLLKVALTP